MCQSELNVPKLTRNDTQSTINTDPVPSVPKCNWCTKRKDYQTDIPKMIKNDPSVPVFGSVHFYMGF